MVHNNKPKPVYLRIGASQSPSELIHFYLKNMPNFEMFFNGTLKAAQHNYT